MTLTGEALLRRFLLHVLPKGLVRVRHFGFLANRCRAKRLVQLRAALAAPPPVAAQPERPAHFDGIPCPKCRTGRLRVTARLAPQRMPPPRRDGGYPPPATPTRPRCVPRGQAARRPAAALVRRPEIA